MLHRDAGRRSSSVPHASPQPASVPRDGATGGAVAWGGADGGARSLCVLSLRFTSAVPAVALFALAVTLGCGDGRSIVYVTDARTDLGLSTGIDASTDRPSVDIPAVDIPFVCHSPADCVGHPHGAVCDVPTGQCVGCVSTADTCPADHHCDDAIHGCVPGCRNDTGCPVTFTDAGFLDASFPVGNVYCDTLAHACVACLADSHCPAGTVCSGHVCVPGCSDALVCGVAHACCAGGCVDPATDASHCGDCNTLCAYPNASALCLSGRCAMGTCTQGFADCDRDPRNGCEVDTRVDVTHCGACGTVCALPNAIAGCGMGACTVASCRTGFGDCDGVPGNGCETWLGGDLQHCGACGTPCPTGLVCNDGTCGPAYCCADLHGRAPTVPDGVYPLAPGGSIGPPTFSAYCDMTTEGGGWTLVMMLPDDATGAYGFDAALWTDASLVNPDVTDPMMNVPLKGPAYFRVPVLSQMRFCVGTRTACVDETISQADTQSVFLGPATPGGRTVTDFVPLGASGSYGCTRVGFNIQGSAGASRCRYGLLVDTTTTCGPTIDSALGVGCVGAHGAAISAGQGDGVLPLRRTRGWIWVR